MSNCSICNEPLSSRSQLSLCPNCRAYIGRWRLASPAHIIAHSEKLDLRRERMTVLGDVPRKKGSTIEPVKGTAPKSSGNIVSILRKRA